MTQQINHSYDVLIIGAGPAGTSAALTLLNHSDLRVAIIEQSDLQKLRVGESVSSTLFPLLDYLQVPKDCFNADCFTETQSTIAFWGSDTATQRHAIFAADMSTYQVDREQFDLTLIDAVAGRGGIIYPRSKLQHMTFSEEAGWQVTVQHKEHGKITLNTGFIIDASGRNSTVINKVGSQRQSLDKLTGVGAFVRCKGDTRLPREQVIESTKHGWWYIAALPSQHAVVTFFSDSDLLSSLRMNRPEQWLSALQETNHAKHFLRNELPANIELWVRKANSTQTQFDHIKHFVSVGDAACSFDPISSMGLGFAMTSSAQAAVLVSQSFKEKDERISKLLQQYQKDIYNNFEDYLSLRNMFYAKEKRWAGSPFWQRRLRA
ncbi:MAG: 2-polyprenyl-6-methoxyphenol hydroxylase-like FAD-dependent oxidoreductase [Paraglaciecola sp.]|jgi:2-polyprenyl-6-methoxyphenol hydroxylase-like FAD-dependent oxidoreductase